MCGFDTRFYERLSERKTSFNDKKSFKGLQKYGYEVDDLFLEKSKINSLN